jgi:hypothetical protein
MAKTTYQFSISTDFPNAEVHGAKLKAEVAASSIAAVCCVSRAGDFCDVTFDDALSAGDETTLNGLVAAHDGVKPKNFGYASSSKLVPLELNIPNDDAWHEVGGVTTTMGAFVSNPADALGKLIGEHKTTGANAQIRARYSSDDGLLISPVTLPNSSGAWAVMDFNSDQAFRLNTETIIVEAKCPAGETLDFRFVTATLLRAS